MDVVFQKSAYRKHLPPWIAVNGKSRIVGSHLGSTARHLPHDIVTLVVERELGIADGFFGTVAAGGTFRSMRKRRHAAGKAVIAANRPGLARAEHAVNEAWSAWRSGRPTACKRALDAADEAWAKVAPGATLTLTWDVPNRPAHRSRR